MTTDTADYPVGESGLQTTRGIIVSITHLLVGETFEGHKPIYVTNDGYDTTDRLLSIEKIIGTNRTDRVNVGSLNISDYGLTGKTLEFDGRLSRDVIDFSSYGGPVYLGDSKSGGGQIEVFRDKGLTDSTGLKFKSFEYVTLSSNADFVRTTVAGLEVETREGADTIYVSNGLGVNDLSAEDRVVLANLELHGGPSPQMV